MKSILILFVFLSASTFAQKEEDVVLKTETGNIKGKILLPKKNETKTVVLIIAGSGPTDMNGNNPMMQNNSLKMLAEGLHEAGIASLRYDKRGVASSVDAMKKEEDLRFEDYINDAKSWVALLSKDKRFENIMIAGHSEGSLIGAVATVASENVVKYISLAGIGEPAYTTIRKQLEPQSDEVKEQAFLIMDELEKGNLVKEIPQSMMSIFRPSVQPYIISWFKYNPLDVFAKLKVPALIVQGTTDIQVEVENAHLLKKTNSLCEELIIDGMNHILKEAPEDMSANVATYSKGDLALHKDLMKPIVAFILK